MASEKKDNRPTLRNRKATFDYKIEKTYEAGIVLKGTEVKSIREGKASLVDTFAYMDKGELWLKGMYIKPYEHGSYFNHDAHRERKLLLNKDELAAIDKSIERAGATVVPLKLYFKGPNVKVQIGLASGKKKHDKRASIAEKDQKRDLARSLKDM